MTELGEKLPLEGGKSLAGQTPTRGNAESQHRDRIASLGVGKNRSREISDYIAARINTSRGVYRKQLEKLHYEVSTCANWLLFHHYYTIDEIRLAKMTSCKKHLLCPVCARLRGAKALNRYLERFQQIQVEQPKLIPAFLTLTVKNGGDLAERFAHLKNSYDRLKQKRRDALKGKGKTEFSKISGAVHSYEVTNIGNGYHPHIHMIVMIHEYLDQPRLSSEWEIITGDSCVVDIRKIHGEPVSSFLEVFKYAVKFSDMALEHNFEAYETLRGKRLQDSWGCFRGVKIPETLTDDLLSDELPYLEMFYQYKPGFGFDLEAIRRY